MERLASSYRDPAGYVFARDGIFYRFLSPSYFEHYDLLHTSGLYDELVRMNRLIRHREVSDASLSNGHMAGGKIILPEQIETISYPYEWPFNMWRDAAVVTLKIAQTALDRGMILKDATPFNIQFLRGRPVFIDTASFEKYEEGKPWIAYRQFCESFLAPLLLMHYVHRDCGKIFLSYPDGIPLEVVKQMLPARAKWNLHVYLHIWLQQKISARKKDNGNHRLFPRQKLKNLLEGLLQLVEGLRQKKTASEWGDYYSATISGGEYLSDKTEAVRRFAADNTFRTVIDLGANDGLFSLLFKDAASQIISVDGDSVCVNELYLNLRKSKVTNILPLTCALNNPTPGIGWQNEERPSLTARLKGDLVLALALVHHLAITNNLPLSDIAAAFRKMAPQLLVEFVPRDDEKAALLLQNRKDACREYTLENFIAAFSKEFVIVRREMLPPAGRILFHMKARNEDA